VSSLPSDMKGSGQCQKDKYLTSNLHFIGLEQLYYSKKIVSFTSGGSKKQEKRGGFFDVRRKEETRETREMGGGDRATGHKSSAHFQQNGELREGEGI
jgi:hypothetical protein